MCVHRCNHQRQAAAAEAAAATGSKRRGKSKKPERQARILAVKNNEQKWSVVLHFFPKRCPFNVDNGHEKIKQEDQRRGGWSYIRRHSRRPRRRCPLLFVRMPVRKSQGVGHAHPQLPLRRQRRWEERGGRRRDYGRREGDATRKKTEDNRKTESGTSTPYAATAVSASSSFPPFYFRYCGAPAASSDMDDCLHQRVYARAGSGQGYLDTDHEPRKQFRGFVCVSSSSGRQRRRRRRRRRREWSAVKKANGRGAPAKVHD
jgi:hypothetical protein